MAGVTGHASQDRRSAPASARSAPGSLPVVRLHELLDHVGEVYAWYARDLSRAFWAKQPDPVAACQELTRLDGQLELLILACVEARRHVSLLFDLSFDESTRRREAQSRTGS